MPELKNSFFTGSGDLPLELLQQLTTNSPTTGVHTTLERLGWDGSPVAAVCLTTSTDGLRVNTASFALWGVLSADTITVPASKLWDGVARGTTLHIRNLSGQHFRFSGGQMHSDFLDSDRVDFNFTRSEQPILPADWEANHVGNFTLRLIAHLDKTSNKSSSPKVKYTVLATPGTADELLQLSDRAQHVSWPGIKLLEGTTQLFPLATEVQWGCPVLPLICTKDRGENITAYPSGQHLRFAVAEVFRTAALPTACTTRGALHEKGQEIMDAEEEPETRSPAVTWPAAERPPIEQGIIIFSCEQQLNTT